ncbi:MAG TPA: NRDE family protein, partial [Pseudomonadales bacterium]
YQPDTDRPLIVAANRDEFYARPASSAHHWHDAPQVFAGRDLTAGGSWLGVTTGGRFATVTNFAEESPTELAPASRGALVEGFLKGSASAHQFVHGIHGLNYKGFNLLVFDGSRLAYTSNRGFTEDLEAGVYGLANAELGATWPKVVAGTRALQALQPKARTADLIRLLADETQPPDTSLPRRGRPIELERRAAPCFIRGDEYGTRASTAVIFDARANCIHFAEQLYLPAGEPAGLTEVTLPLS